MHITFHFEQWVSLPVARKIHHFDCSHFKNSHMFFNFSVDYIFLIIHTGFLLTSRKEHFNLNIMASLHSVRTVWPNIVYLALVLVVGL